MSKSPAAMLGAIGRALYGESWGRPLARALGEHERQIRRWMDGGRLTADHEAFTTAQKLLRRRIAEFAAIADELERWRRTQ